MPDERSSASAMTGEKAEREKAMSISLQTWPRRRLDHRQRDGIDGAVMALLPPTAMRRLPMASTVATAPGSITVVASICCTMAGPADARAERQPHAVEHLRRLPAPVGEHRALADHGVLRPWRARPAGVDQRGDGERAPPADHRRHEVDQHRPDLRQLAPGSARNRPPRTAPGSSRATRPRAGMRRGSGASGRGTACRRRAARWSRRSRSAPRR